MYCSPASCLLHALSKWRKLYGSQHLQLSGGIQWTPLRTGCERVPYWEALRPAVCQYAWILLLPLSPGIRITGGPAELPEDLFPRRRRIRGEGFGERHRRHRCWGGHAAAEDRAVAGQRASAHQWAAEIAPGHLQCGGHAQEPAEHAGKDSKGSFAKNHFLIICCNYFFAGKASSGCQSTADESVQDGVADEQAGGDAEPAAEVPERAECQLPLNRTAFPFPTLLFKC